MVDTRNRNRNPRNDDNGYGDVPSRGAVGVRGGPAEYRTGYGRDGSQIDSGIVDDGHGGPPDDAGYAPPYSRYRSGYGAFGDRDRDEDVVRRKAQNDGEVPFTRSYQGRGPKGYKRSDERIHEDVCERLTHDPMIDASNLEVAVKDGEVTLSGTVASRGLRRRAEDLAELASGVNHVQNNLRVEGVV